MRATDDSQSGQDNRIRALKLTTEATCVAASQGASAGATSAPWASGLARLGRFDSHCHVPHNAACGRLSCMTADGKLRLLRRT